MPEIIEPTNPEDAAEEIAALQEVPAEDEDVQAHSDIGLGTTSTSVISTVNCT